VVSGAIPHLYLKEIEMKFAQKLMLATGIAMSSAIASAQTTGFDAVLDAVDLAGVATKIGALAVLIVGIALVFKGPDLAKRIIRKV
jgi:hypothetical protein